LTSLKKQTNGGARQGSFDGLGEIVSLGEEPEEVYYRKYGEVL